MQRVTNCILLDRETNQVLLLKKPRRGWWVAPGGKMEAQESITESVKREYKEETGIDIVDPVLKGVSTMVIEENDQVVDEWMMFTFFTDTYKGTLLDESPEGELEWVPIKDIASLPKAEGDQQYIDHVLREAQNVLVRKFRYTTEYELISYQ
ncbi:NUDIX domain-containing protein [Caldalkalibacillus salinus]|uniref:NUDIX domain-containing protein n=1 Tax=Caldalkalibacillus salinus TaxID=2803787 RepID=UPI0019238A90